MKSRPAAYLHIGINKTGTSSIQSYLSLHRSALLREGVLYPEAGRGGVAHYELSRRLGFFHDGKSVADNTPAALARLRKDLGHELKSTKAQVVVFSSEMFVLEEPVVPVREFLADMDTQIVVYLRRHDHWWLSAYSQAVKTVANPPWGRGLERFIRFSQRRKQNKGRYRHLVDRWADVFGRENIIVRPFEEAQNPGGVVADFLRTIGLASFAAEVADAAPHLNQSLGAEALFLLDIIQRADVSTETRELLKQHIASQPGTGSIEGLMEPSLRRRLIEENRADYEYIAKTYLGRDDGVLFTEAEPAADAQWQRPATPNVIEVVSKFIQVLESANKN